MFSRLQIKTPAQLALMRASGRLLSAVLEEVRAAIVPGATPRDLDQLAEALIADAGAQPNFKGYEGYPATLCVSVNDVVVHGIPDDTPFTQGDVVSVDGGLVRERWHSDSAFTEIVGRPSSADDERLVRVTEGALWAGIAEAATARRIGQIGEAIEDYVEIEAGDELSHLEGFGGHGIGTQMHMEPSVMNYRVRSRGPRIRPGLCIAIEPMLIEGDGEWAQLDDGWTIRTLSGRKAAHFEHSIAFTREGICVLTAEDAGVEGLAPYGITPCEIPAQ